MVFSSTVSVFFKFCVPIAEFRLPPTANSAVDFSFQVPKFNGMIFAEVSLSA